MIDQLGEDIQGHAEQAKASKQRVAQLQADIEAEEESQVSSMNQLDKLMSALSLLSEFDSGLDTAVQDILKRLAPHLPAGSHAPSLSKGRTVQPEAPSSAVSEDAWCMETPVVQPVPGRRRTVPRGSALTLPLTCAVSL